MKKLDCNSYLNDAFVHSPCSPVPLSSSEKWNEKRREKEGNMKET